MDFTAEIWAYATTLWEIFSHGRTPTLREFYASKRKLQRPRECPDEMYDIMREGWHETPDKRFSPQAVFSKLIIARRFNGIEKCIAHSTKHLNFLFSQVKDKMYTDIKRYIHIYETIIIQR